MPTVQETIDIGKVSTYLSGADLARGVLYGATLYPDLPSLIAMETDSINWINEIEPTEATLEFTAKYLFSLCGSYAPKAYAIIANDGGSPIPTVYSTGYIYDVMTDTIASDNTVYFNDSLINGEDVRYMFIDNQYTPIAEGDFNKTTGVITGLFFAGSEIVIPFNRKL